MRLPCFSALGLGIFVLASTWSNAQPLTRTVATTLTLPAEAPVQGYSTFPVFGDLTFEQPVALVAPPRSTNRLFVVEKAGRIMVLPDQGNPTPSVFLDLRSRVGDATNELGLLALAFHPDYATNGYFYVWYTLNTTTAAGTGLHNRLARFQVSADDPDVADPDSGEPLLTQRDEAPNHNGGDLHFGPDGYLYLSLGDEGGANDQFQNSQRIDRDFFSGILRIDVDQRPGSLAPNPHPAVHAGTYRVPPDNPFVGVTSFNGAAVNAAAVRTELWAVGLRNPWRMSFDPSTHRLWVGDVGQEDREEINVITPGGNYGWSYREGTIAGPRSSPPGGAEFIEPVFDYTNSGGSSITGGIVYHNIQLSQLEGAYVFADYITGAISALRSDGVSRGTATPLTTDPGIVAFLVNPRDGNILLVDLDEGVIKRLGYTGTPTGDPFPTALSATGAFSSLDPLTPQPGVVAYTPNVAFWSDHARKQRWFALRDDTSIFGYNEQETWTLPTGAVWVKHFDLDLTRGDPTTARRVETRFLVKTETGIYGLSYRWNEAQTDATLVSEGGTTQNFTVVEDGVSRNQTWRFPSRSECFACHTPQADFVLTFNTRQMNREHAFPGGTANQLTALAAAGYLTPPPAEPASLPALVSPTDTTQPVEARTRAYLDVNCAQCHLPGGQTPGTWDARYHTPLSFTDIINGHLVDDGGTAENRIIVPGDVALSRLFHRISATSGATRMPGIGTLERDYASEELILDWIAELGVPKPPSRLANLSGRAIVGTGDNVLIPGFVVEGTNPRQVLIRAVGPALASFNVPDFIPQPTMTLYSGQDVLATNTRWHTAANAAAIRTTTTAVGAFALPEGGNDSAMLTTLAPGAYTVRIADDTGASGVALFELYDTETGGSVRLANTSVRARVGGGSGVIIPGLIVSPGAFKTVLIRAVGPGLEEHNVPDFLPAPVLTLYAGPEAFATNQSWGSADNAAAIASTAQTVGAFPLASGSNDSALLVTLSPGAYTLHVSSGDGMSGVALVEVYEVP